MEIKYYCQTAIQDIFDHMIPVPDNFEVSPQYLYGLSNSEYINSFKKLREILINVYKDMQEHPEEYGLICTSLEVTGFGVSDEIRKSKNSIRWLINVLFNLGKSGEISGEALIVDPAKYEEINRIKWNGYKCTSDISVLIEKLYEFDFEFSGLKGTKLDKKADKYILSFSKDANIIKALKGYMMSVPVEEHFSIKLLRLDYKLLIDNRLIPENQAYIDFLSYIDDEEEKLFFEKLHERLLKNGYLYGTWLNGDNIRYFAKQKDKNYTVECQSDGRKLVAGMKLSNMDLYSDYIHSLPKHIKTMLSRSSCRRSCTFQGATPESCKFRIIWHVDNVEYRKCCFEDVFVPSVYNANDMDYYIQLLILDKKCK